MVVFEVHVVPVVLLVTAVEGGFGRVGFTGIVSFARFLTVAFE